MLGSASSSSMKRLPQGRHQASAGTADSPVDTARKPRSMSSAPLSIGGGQGTPPRLRPESSHTERGITLQTLIVTAVLVLVAVGAALVLVAINRSSSDDFEEAGNIDIEGKCQTWEIHLATLEAAGHGGPEGHGGVFSSNIGCLATCYWELTNWALSIPNAKWELHPGAYSVRNRKVPQGTTNPHPHVSKLYYHDDNRAPAIDQIRLGVVSLRVGAGTQEPSRGFGAGTTDHLPGHTSPGNAGPDKDGKSHYFRFRPGAKGAMGNPGRPLTPAMIKKGIATIAEPNWMSRGNNPGSGVLATNYPKTSGATDSDWERYLWEDESWEVRADPGREVCEIVNVAHDDLLVCSSAKEECESTT